MILHLLCFIIKRSLSRELEVLLEVCCFLGRERLSEYTRANYIKGVMYLGSQLITDSEITVSYYIERMALITWISEGRC